MPPVIDVTALSYATAGIVVYYLLLFALSATRRSRASGYAGDWPLVVIVIPARNEAAVLINTVEAALRCPYDGEVRILIADDASTDATGRLAERLASSDPRIR